MRGDFDIVVAMYHDQGRGPLGLEADANITVGLPIIRTSVAREMPLILREPAKLILRV